MKKWILVEFWKRYIDDGIGLWAGQEEEFHNFINDLNKESLKYGIHFPIKEVQFGKSVNFLDLTIYLDNENKIQHKLYIKPTDARTYLNPGSFHAPHVFASIPFSQMIRVIKRNTKEDTCKEDVELLKNDLIKSGYKDKNIDKMKNKAFERIKSPKAKTMSVNNTIVFTVDFFEELSIFKELVSNIEKDIKAVFGNISILVATRKCSSIGNLAVKNKAVCLPDRSTLGNQKCGDKRCKICALMITTNSVIVNNKEVLIPSNLNCKTKKCIYLCICNKCTENNAYFGQTIQKQHNRMSGHRDKFNMGKYKKSALSMHAYDTHGGELALNDFSIAVLKTVQPRRLNREEFTFIDKFDTLTKGLNRYQVN